MIHGVHRYKPIVFVEHYCSRHPDIIKVPNSAVAVDARAELACYPRSSFYPLIFGRL